ncbi:MAG TPA: FAD-dependent oxidoreductase [Ktedonobacterales bacterium]|nr:FAD-dependent oxidoreductase [Ktedonobacterales bacterium]
MTAAKTTQRSVDYLLIGGGLASATAAEEIRARDPNGSILIVAGEPYLPYHRPPLSKEYLRGDIEAEGTYGDGGVFAQLPPWYAEQRVEVIGNTAVSRLDTTAKTATLEDGGEIGYGKALIATGGRARALSIPGATLPGVMTLRTLDDATAIRERLATAPNPQVVVIGSGFIGLETASNSLYKGARVAIVDMVERAWPGMLTTDLSAWLQNEFMARGAEFHFGHLPREFIAGPDGRVAAVRIAANGFESPLDLRADLVIVGVGIQLNIEAAKASGISVDPRHGVMVDDHLRTSAPDVWAAGDVAAYIDPVMGRFHFEHWDNAISSAQTAAANMTGDDERYIHIPYFFSDQFDLAINMLGYPSPDAEVTIRGDMAREGFTAVFVRDGCIRAALMVNDDAKMDAWRDAIAAGAQAPDSETLASSNFDPATLTQG